MTTCPTSELVKELRRMAVPNCESIIEEAAASLQALEERNKELEGALKASAALHHTMKTGQW